MAEIQKALKNPEPAAPGGPLIVKKGLGVNKVYYLRENQSSFPGVSVQRVFTREYKDGDVAAHLFGNVGEVTAQQLKEPRYAGLTRGTRSASRASSTSTTDSSEARPGPTACRSTPSGARPSSSKRRPAQAGDDVRLTID